MRLDSIRLSRKKLLLFVAVVLWLLFLQIVEQLPVGVVAMLAVPASIIPVMSVLLFYPSVVPVGYRIGATVLASAGMGVMFYLLPTASNPDAVQYYYAIQHKSISELFHQLVAEFSFTVQGLSNGYTLYPLLAKLWVGKFMELAPRMATVFNFCIWILASLAWVNAVHKHVDNSIFKRASFLGLLFLFLLILPSSVFWTTQLAKDIPSVALSMLAATTLANRRYVLGVLLLVLSLQLRLYAPFLGLVFFLFLSGRNRVLFLGAVMACLFVFVYAHGNLAPVFNTVVISGYTILSPNPVDPSNWQLLHQQKAGGVLPTLPLTLEGITLFVLFVLGLYSMLRKSRYQREYIRLACALYIGACVLTLVGYRRQMILGDPYHFWMLGESIIRKKLAIWPLVVTWCSIVATQLYYKFSRGLAGQTGHVSINRQKRPQI